MKKETTPLISPTCHLFTVPELTKEILSMTNLEQVCSFTEESHLIRRLLRCNECNQLYFYEFREEIDWINGEDPQYRTYIAVADKEPLGSLINSNMFFSGQLENHAHIKHDWPSDGPQKVSRFYQKNSP